MKSLSEYRNKIYELQEKIKNSSDSEEKRVFDIEIDDLIDEAIEKCICDKSFDREYVSPKFRVQVDNIVEYDPYEEGTLDDLIQEYLLGESSSIQQAIDQEGMDSVQYYEISSDDVKITKV